MCDVPFFNTIFFNDNNTYQQMNNNNNKIKTFDILTREIVDKLVKKVKFFVLFVR